MVIGFDGSRAFGAERTGTENYSYQLLKALSKIDKKNNYIVFTSPFTQHSTIVESYMNFPQNFTFMTVAWSYLWTQAGLALQTFKDPLDVLFIPAHTLPVIRKPGLKTVITVHDLGSEYLPSMHKLKQRLYLSFMQKYQLKGATKIISVSKATKIDLVKRVGIEADKVEVVYEGYDKNIFSSVSDELLINRLRYYNLQPKTYYLFVGTVQPRKNLERVIKAFAIHLRGVGKAKPGSHLGGESRLVIVGSKGWLSDKIYDLPKKLGIEDKVKFLGYVPEKDLPILYSGASALLLPSLFEGFGLPILEAQACGCPVITSNISSMPEVAGKGAVFVDPYNVDDIVKGIVRLQATGYRQQLIRKGKENIKRFSWEKCAFQTLMVFEKIRSTKS